MGAHVILNLFNRLGKRRSDVSLANRLIGRIVFHRIIQKYRSTHNRINLSYDIKTTSKSPLVIDHCWIIDFTSCVILLPYVT